MFSSPTFRNCHPERSEGLATEDLPFVLASASSFALAFVQVFAVILSTAKDPDKFDLPRRSNLSINNF
jgi:hypothetical protein